MFSAPAPFTGDRTKVTQYAPGNQYGNGPIYHDAGTGHYFTGSWDSATDWGTDASQVYKPASDTTNKQTPPGYTPPPVTNPGVPPAAPVGLVGTDKPSGRPVAPPAPPVLPTPPPGLNVGGNTNTPTGSQTASSQGVPRTPAPTSGPNTSNLAGNYNTTPDWMDPNAAPNINESYWGNWIKANPDYLTSHADEINRQLQYYVSNFGKTHPGSDPSTVSDSAYWAKQIMGTHANGQYDFPYWESRMMQNGGGGGGGGNNPAPNANAPMDYNAALAYVNGKLGRTLSPAEISEAFAKFGGSSKDMFVPAGLDPVVAYFKSKGGPGPGPTTPPKTNPTPNPNPTPTDLGPKYSPPGDPGIFPGPTQQVGQDPLSQLTTGALANLLLQGGRLQSPNGQLAEKAMADYFNRGGNANSRLESIREKMALLERGQMNDARGELASRGLLSEGSTAQGPEMSTVGRIATNIAPQYSQAARDALIADDQQMQSAITLATGLDEQAANRVLQTANSVGSRQQMLGELALKSLDQNMSWNKFLAQYGLDRAKVMYDLQNNQAQTLLPLITAFTQWLNTTNNGFV